MAYTFKLSDYYDIFRQLDEEFDGSFGELEPIKIKETKDSELYVYPLRTVIPTLDISIREGLEYFGPSDGDGSDALVIYEARETDPDKYLWIASAAQNSVLLSAYMLSIRAFRKTRSMIWNVSLTTANSFSLISQDPEKA